jgi:hypothetical protein
MLRVTGTISLLLFLSILAHGQSDQAVIKLTNKSFLPLTAKVVGPTPKAARINSGASKTFRLQPGRYYLFYEFYDSDEKKSQFLRTELFDLKAGNDIVAEADSRPTYHPSYSSPEGYHIRVWLLESDFLKPPGWPAEGVKVESHPGFTTLKVLATVGDLYLGDRDDERSYVTGIAKAFVNRRIPRDVLAPLRRQGFRPVFSWAPSPKAVPQQFSEPTLLITYEEGEGRKFLVGSGVSIALRFSLYGAGDKLSEPLWEEVVGGGNDDEVNVNLLNANASFRTNSLSALRKSLDEFGLDLSQWKAKN